MKHDDFIIEMTRLAEGFEVHLTKPRIEAWWEQFGQEARTDCFQWAITHCLTQSYFPKHDEFLAALNMAANIFPWYSKKSEINQHIVTKVIEQVAEKLGMA